MDFLYITLSRCHAPRSEGRIFGLFVCARYAIVDIYLRTLGMVTKAFSWFISLVVMGSISSSDTMIFCASIRRSSLESW